MRVRKFHAVLAVAAAAGGLIIAAPAAHAAQSTQTLQCSDGSSLPVSVTLRTNNNNSSDNGGWASAKVVSGGTGHLSPTSFGFTLTDAASGDVLFSGTQTKGNGNAEHNQTAVVTCTQSQTGPISAILGPGDQLPPGVSPDEVVTFTLTATAVVKP